MLLPVTPLSPEMAQAVLAMLKSVAVPFDGADKALEIRLSLEAISEGRHQVAPSDRSHESTKS